MAIKVRDTRIDGDVGIMILECDTFAEAISKEAQTLAWNSRKELGIPVNACNPPRAYYDEGICKYCARFEMTHVW